MNLLLEGALLGDDTDVSGKYLFRAPRSQVVNRHVRLHASFVGFSPVTKEIYVAADTVLVNFELEEDTEGLEGIILCGEVLPDTSAHPQ